MKHLKLILALAVITFVASCKKVIRIQPQLKQKHKRMPMDLVIKA